MEEQKFEFVEEVIRKKPGLFKRVLGKIASLAGVAVVFLIGVAVVIFLLRDDLRELLNTGADYENVQGDSKVYVPVNSGKSEYEDVGQAQQTVEKCMVEILEKSDKKKTKVLCRGVIIYKNQDVYILAPKSSLGKAEEFLVTFGDGESSVCSLWNEDKNLGIAALKVANKDINEATMQSIAAGIVTGSGLQKDKTYIYMGFLEDGQEITCSGTIFKVEEDKNIYDISPRRIYTDLELEDELSGFLFDENGSLIGISTGKEHDTGRISAVAFYDIYDIVYKMLNKVEMGYIGIQGQYVDYNVKKYIGDDIPDGFFVLGLDSTGNAYQAGIMKGDVIISADGASVNHMSDLTSVLLKKSPGESLQIVLERKMGQNYEEMSVDVVVGVR